MSSSTEFDLSKLSAMLRTKRGDKGLRDVAEEIGNVSASTLSRIEQGNVPDLDTFARICRWLAASPSEFMRNSGTKAPQMGKSERSGNTPDFIETHLRAERILPPDTINALSEMVRLAYKAANEGKLNRKK